MIHRRTQLPLVLVLLFAIAVGVLWHWCNRLTVSESPVGVSSAADSSAAGPAGFGPIPLNVASNDSPAEVPLRDEEGTSGDMRKLAARMSRETADLKVVTHADGRRSVSLEGRFLHMSAVVAGPDGEPEVRCFTDFQQMTAALPGGSPTVSPRPATYAR
jgi:hypothetical protein